MFESQRRERREAEVLLIASEVALEFCEGAIRCSVHYRRNRVRRARIGIIKRDAHVVGVVSLYELLVMLCPIFSGLHPLWTAMRYMIASVRTLMHRLGTVRRGIYNQKTKLA